jgi:hypothetical protein
MIDGTMSRMVSFFARRMASAVENSISSPCLQPTQIELPIKKAQNH